MKPVLKTMAAVMFAASVGAASPSWAGIRCGSDIIDVGDTTFEVLHKLKFCGKALGRATIGMSTERTGNGKEEKVVEHWLIQVGQYCYIIKFTGGVLTEIGNWERCSNY